jgi:hypothetical protein
MRAEKSTPASPALSVLPPPFPAYGSHLKRTAGKLPERLIFRFSPAFIQGVMLSYAPFHLSGLFRSPSVVAASDGTGRSGSTCQ